MGTVIDELIVELKLDPKGFDEGQKKAVNDLRKFETEHEKHAKNIAASTNKMTDGFALLQGKLLSIASLFLGGMGVQAFTEHITRLTSQTGYLASSLGVSTTELGKWQGVAASVGASASEIAQGFASIQRNMANMQLTGQSPLNAFAYATHQSGQGPAVDLYDQKGQWRSPTDILLGMSRWASKQQNPAVASQALSQTGMSQGMINLLMLGPQELEKRLKQYEKFAPSKEDTRKFQELQEAMAKTAATAEKLGRNIVLIFSPGLIKFMESIARIVEAFGRSPIEGLKALNDEASKGVGEAFNSASELDRKAGAATTKGGIWNGIKSWWNGTPVEEPATNSRIQWHNPFARAQSEAAKREREQGTTANTAGMSGDGPGGASATTPAPQVRRSSQPIGEGSSGFLRDRRQRYADEIAQTPGLRDRVGGMLALEGTAQPTMESLLNRIDYVNTERAKRGLPPKSIDDMLNSGFYGPINRGQHQAGINQYQRNPGKFDRAIDRALGGSHVIGGYTDQGLPTDPNGSVRNAQRGLSFPYMKIGGNEFTDWAGGPGSRGAASAYRTMIEEGLAREANVKAAGSPSALTGRPMASAANRTFDNWNKLGLGARGALVTGGGSSVTNSRSSSTSIENLNVTVPEGASPGEYASGIKQDLQRYDTVMNANQGLL